MSSNKPVVRYIATVIGVTVGESAFVKTIDHPNENLNRAPYTITSVVLKINPDGFETMNTIYVEDR